MELPIVHEFGSVETSKARYAKHALRHVAFEPFGFAEEDYRSPVDDSATHQAQSAQQFFGFATARLAQATNPNRFRDCGANLRNIQIIEGPLGRGLIFPTPLVVHALEKHAVVFIDRHAPGRVADAQIGNSPVLIRSRRAWVYASRNYIAVTGYSNSLELWKHRRIDSLDFGAHLFNCALTHFLAHNEAFWRDSEQYMPTPLVEHGTNCRRSFASSSSRGFELKRFGFPGTCEFP